METHYNIEEIIIKSLDQTATVEEMAQLKAWIEASEENQAAYFQMKDVWDTTPIVSEDSQADQSWKKLQTEKSVQRPGIMRRIFIETAKVAAVAVLVLVSAYFVYFNSGSRQEEIQYATVQVPYGSKSTILLPDGSEVMLNAGSELTYPVNFSETIRNVELKGEGYFKVAHNAEKPFIVTAQQLEVKVLGTEFNVMAYEELNRIETTLINGSVQLNMKRATTGRGVILKPGQKATFEDGKLSLQIVNTEIEAIWTQNEFYFESIPFPELIMRLEKWYDVQIEFEEHEFDEITFTGKFRNEETIWQVLDAIEMTTPVRYRAEHRKVYITYKK